MSKEYRNSWLRSPKGRFYQHRCNAQQRGVPFTLTFEEWINLWGDKYEKRGCKEGDYVMCRQGDVGAYEAGNVFIDTAKANISQVPPSKMISSAKINRAIAEEIREDLLLGALVKTCAEKYGISRQSVSDIKWRRTWL